MTTASSRARAFMWRSTASSRRCDSKPAGFGTKAIRRMPWGAIKGVPRHSWSSGAAIDTQYLSDVWSCVAGADTNFEGFSRLHDADPAPGQHAPMEEAIAGTV